MKKTLTIGLALALGLNACSPMMSLHDLAYIRVENGNKELGNTATWSEFNVDYGDAITLNEKGEAITLKVETTMPYWHFGHDADPMTLLHQYTADDITLPAPPTWIDHNAGLPEMEFFAIPDGVSTDGIGDMWIDNDYLRLTYRCPITVWGKVGDDGKLVLWENGPRELPILKYQMFSGDVKVSRKVGTTETASPLPTPTVDAALLTFLMDTYSHVTNATIALACMEDDFENDNMLPNVERVVAITYQDYAFEMHVEGIGAAVPFNSPKYSGFHVILPKVFQTTTAITYKLK